MNQHCSFRSRVKRSIRWVGKNLILSVAIVAGVIALWPSHSPGLYFAKNVMMEQASFSMDHAESESMPMMRKSMGRSGGDMERMIMPEPVFADDFAPEAEDRKIVRNASLQIEVPDTEAARKDVERKIALFKGHITNLHSYEVRMGVLSYNLTIRVPAQNLPEVMEELISLGIKKSESINEQDITAQYIDTESRLKNLEVRRDRLRELMDRKTDNLADVLQIDRELSSVQQQIENHERTLRRNDVNVAFSTVNLSLQPEPQIGDFSSPEWTVKKSWKHSVNDLISSLKDIFDSGLRIIIFAPIWIPILLILWAIQRFIRRRICCPIQFKK